MKFGLFYLPTYMPDARDAQSHYRGIVEQVEFADQIGIDYAWIVEHHSCATAGCPPRITRSCPISRPVSNASSAAPGPPCRRQRSGAGGRTGSDPRPTVARPLRFRRWPRFYPRRVRHFRRRHEGQPREGRGRRRTHQAGLGRPDHGIEANSARRCPACRGCRRSTKSRIRRSGSPA